MGKIENNHVRLSKSQYDMNLTFLHICQFCYVFCSDSLSDVRKNSLSPKYVGIGKIDKMF